VQKEELHDCNQKHEHEKIEDHDVEWEKEKRLVELVTGCVNL